jgi:glycosyltransferase involved in cell wall biosynthesis
VTREPLVTVGITCFNSRETILRALRSAARQDWPTIEIVAVDDASTDGSLKIIRDFKRTESRVKLISHPENLGVACARNTILENARGEFIAFFDDDDESYSNRVREQVRVLVQCEKATGSCLVACYAGGIRLYENGYQVDAPAIGAHPPIPSGTAVADHLLFFKPRHDWFFGSGVPASALLARRVLFEDMNGFDQNQRRLEDVDFAVRLALRGGYFTGTQARLYARHMTYGQDKSAEANLKAEIALAEKHRSYLQAIGRYEYARRWPRLRYWHFKRRYHRFALEFFCLMLRYPIAAVRHILATGPTRLVHEHKMRKRRAA